MYSPLNLFGYWTLNNYNYVIFYMLYVIISYKLYVIYFSWRHHSKGDDIIIWILKVQHLHQYYPYMYITIQPHTFYPQGRTTSWFGVLVVEKGIIWKTIIIVPGVRMELPIAMHTGIIIIIINVAYTPRIWESDSQSTGIIKRNTQCMSR